MDAINTAEPDEFARLLAELNGTPTGAPVPAPVVSAQPLPMTPAPGPVVPPMPLPAVAPAFGLAVPFPTLGGAAVEAPPVAALPPQSPPAPRAPELMGADELAAPPSPPAPAAPPAATPLVVTPPIGPPLVAAAPLAPPPLATAASVPPPVAPPTSAPPLAAPSLAGPPFAPPTTRPPGDFAALLATPVGADDVSSSAAAPLRFASLPDESDERDLARATAGEWIGLVLAVVLAPIGLIVGIVAAARSAHRRGWVVGVVRATIVIASVLTVVIGVGGYFGYTQLKQQQAHDQTAAASAAFCSTLKSDPSMAELPTFGWPAVAASIPDSLKAMQSYEDRWTKLAKVSPAGIKPDVTKVAAAAKKIIDSVTVARTVDDASNIAVMSGVASASRVPAWQSEYCG